MQKKTRRLSKMLINTPEYAAIHEILSSYNEESINLIAQVIVDNYQGDERVANILRSIKGYRWTVYTTCKDRNNMDGNVSALIDRILWHIYNDRSENNLYSQVSVEPSRDFTIYVS